MADLDKVKDRIRKLLNVAENDAASQGEIDNAVRAARNMMHAFNLEEDDCTLQDEPSNEKDVASAPTTGGKVTRWEGHLARVVCDLVGGVSCYQNSGGTGKIRNGKYTTFGSFCFYGRADLAKLAADTYEELCATVATMGRLKYRGWFRGDGAVYCQGFVSGLAQQIRKADEEAKQTAQGTALVVKSTALIAQQRQEAKQWLSEVKGVRLTTTHKTGGRGSTSAYQHGQRDGLSADLSAAKAAQPQQLT